MSELEKYKERLELTLSGTNCGTFYHDFSKDLIQYDERSQQLLGLPPTTESFDDWVKVIHPDDRGIVSVIRKELANQKPHINISYRVLKKDKAIHIKVDSFIRYLRGKPHASYGLIQDVTALKEQQIELKRKNKELEDSTRRLRAALDEIKTLKGIIPICSYCHKIRDDEGAWNQLEAYLKKHSGADFSHGICPECFERELKKI